MGPPTCFSAIFASATSSRCKVNIHIIFLVSLNGINLNMLSFQYFKLGEDMAFPPIGLSLPYMHFPSMYPLKVDRKG